MKKILAAVSALSLAVPGIAQTINAPFRPLTGDYLGQKPPGPTPQVFARGIVSTDDDEHGAPSFSPDGNEIRWNSVKRGGPGEHLQPVFKSMRRENGQWSTSRIVPFAGAFSPDGRRIFFSAPRSNATNNSPEDIWFVEKEGNGRGTATCLGFTTRWPELQFATGPTIAGNGTLYFMAYMDQPRFKIGIYRSELKGGEYSKPELLPASINQVPALNWTPFVAPDESFLLFSSNRRGSLDPNGKDGWPGGDLYISRRQTDGSWSEPVNLGKPVNSTDQERFPGLSPDGKYLFFCRPTHGHDEDVYWVSARVIEPLRLQVRVGPIRTR